MNVIPQEHIVDYFVKETGLTPAQVVELSITWHVKDYWFDEGLRTVTIECYRKVQTGRYPVPSFCIELNLHNGVFHDDDTGAQVSNVAERLARYLSDTPKTHPLRLALDELARLQAIEARLLEEWTAINKHDHDGDYSELRLCERALGYLPAGRHPRYAELDRRWSSDLEASE